jgi:hypothetical protein
MLRSAPSGTAIHTEAFAEAASSPLGDRAVVDGAKTLACCAVDLWADARLREAVRAAFVPTDDPDRVL